MYQKTNYKILYINGDSYSAGVGLSYEDLYPKNDFFKQRYHKSNMWNFSLKNNQIIQRLLINEFGTGKLDNSKLAVLEKEKSFSKKIEAKSNIPTINNSLGGSSLGEIFQSTVQDVQQLLQKFKPEEIFVTIMLTSVTRLCLPTSLPIGIMNRTFLSAIPSFDGELRSKELKQMKKSFYLNANDQFLFLNGISSVCALINFLHFLKIKYCLLDSCLFKMSINALKTIDVNAKHFYIPISATIDDWFHDKEKIFLPCGHFSENVHEKIADYIFEKYISY